MDIPEIQEIVNLITIRQYVADAIANPSIDRATVNFVDGARLLLDKKILNILQSKKFKNYIDYDRVQQAKIDAVLVSNGQSNAAKEVLKSQRK
jgi:hypothetical protein